jgi:hypothetical protein
MPGRSVHTIKKNIEAVVVAGKGTDLEVNAGTTKYIVMRSECWTKSQFKH